MFLIVGLGNPGKQYEATRHNVGFLFVDYLAKQTNTTVQSQKFRSYYAKITLNNKELILLKPQTFMNLSGQAVQEALSFFKLSANRMIVVTDDLDQNFGAVRLRVGGGHGGHNGLRDIMAKIPDHNFARIKIGIDKPLHKTATADWVLGQMNTNELQRLEQESFPLVQARMHDYIKSKSSDN